jgi:hypothetical protein
MHLAGGYLCIYVYVYIAKVRKMRQLRGLRGLRLEGFEGYVPYSLQLSC